MSLGKVASDSAASPGLYSVSGHAEYIRKRKHFTSFGSLPPIRSHRMTKDASVSPWAPGVILHQQHNVQHRPPFLAST